MKKHICNVIVTVFVFIFILALRIPYIDNPPVEQGEYWRQSDTEAIARNFIDNRFNILYPQFNYDGPKPNYVQLEFQITTFLIALLYKVFGYNYYLARLVPILFFFGSSIYVYLIAKRYYGRAAWFSALAYGIMPLNIFYSRAVMPESAALFFFTGAFYYFIRWYDSGKLTLLWMSALFTCLSISQKTPTAFIGLAMIFLLIKKYKLRFLNKWELWVFAILSLLPNILYIQWSQSIAEFDFISKIGFLHIMPKSFKAFINIDTYRLASVKMIEAISIGLVVLAVIGLFNIEWEKDYAIVFWTGAMILEVISVASIIKLNYYFIFITPIFALWVGKTLEKFLCSNRRILSAFMGLIALAVWNYGICINLFEVKENILRQTEVIERYTASDDLIIIGTMEPALLNQSRRTGWRANIKYYKDIPIGAEKEINYFIQRGAKYFSPLGGYIYGDDGSYRKYLDENFEKLGDNEFFIYKLK